MAVEPLISYLKRNVGIVRSWRVALYVVSWGLYSESLPVGSVPSMKGYVEYWKLSTATAYRERALFAKAFPQCETPEPVYRMFAERLKNASRETTAVGLLGVRKDWGAVA